MISFTLIATLLHSHTRASILLNVTCRFRHRTTWQPSAPCRSRALPPGPMHASSGKSTTCADSPSDYLLRHSLIVAGRFNCVVKRCVLRPHGRLLDARVMSLDARVMSFLHAKELRLRENKLRSVRRGLRLRSLNSFLETVEGYH